FVSIGTRITGGPTRSPEAPTAIRGWAASPHTEPSPARSPTPSTSPAKRPTPTRAALSPAPSRAASAPPGKRLGSGLHHTLSDQSLRHLPAECLVHNV